MGAAYLAEHEALPHVKCVIKLVLVEMAHYHTRVAKCCTNAVVASGMRPEAQELGWWHWFESHRGAIRARG